MTSRSSLVLVGLGGLLMLLAVVFLLAGVVARQSLQSAELQARDHAAELAVELAALQERLADRRVERAATAARQAGMETSDGLLEVLRETGFRGVLDARVFDADLEFVGLDEDAAPDFATLEMLLEARRNGRAVPGILGGPGQGATLALARRLGAIDQRADGILLIRLPVETLVQGMEWSRDLDFIALSQGQGERRSEFWQRGSRPDQTPGRVAISGSRFSLDWHRSSMTLPVGLNAATILAMSGFIVLLLGLRGALPGRRATVTAGGAASAAGAREDRPRAGQERKRTSDPVAASDTIVVVDPPRPPPVAVEQPEQPSTAAGEPPEQPPLELVEAPEPESAPALRSPAPDNGPVVEDSADLGVGPVAEPAVAVQPEPEAKEGSGRGGDQQASPDPVSRRRAEPSPVDPGLFNDAGIVGRYGDGLDERAATLIGQAMGAAALERGVGRIAVARDGRLSGPALLAALTQGLRSVGVDVVDLGAMPAPVLDFAAHDVASQSSIMVSASHMGHAWNGFRIRLQGEPLAGQAVHELLDRIRVGRFGAGKGQLEQAGSIDRYIKAQTARVQLERPLRVVVDCANAISGLVLPRLLSAIGAEVVPLYADVDGSFPNHPPDPSRLEHLEDIRLCVRNFRADLGLAMGGDGDRLVMIGPDGTVIWPDRLLLLLAREHLTRNGSGLIVQDALCSPRVAADVCRRGGRVQVSGLGVPAVWRELKSCGGMLGGTFNGQFILDDDGIGAADGLLAACRLLEILAADTREVGEILADLPSWCSRPIAFVSTRPTAPERILRQLLESADVSDADVSSEHGFTIDYGHAWSRICRSADGSGLVVRIEGDDESAADNLALLVRQMLLAVDDGLQLSF